MTDKDEPQIRFKKDGKWWSVWVKPDSGWIEEAAWATRDDLRRAGFLPKGLVRQMLRRKNAGR